MRSGSDMAASTQRRLGDILVAQGALSRDRLEQALRGLHGRMGHALTAIGVIDGRTLARAVADQHALPQVDLTATTPDAQLFAVADMAHYLAYHYIPLRRDAQGLTLATSEPGATLDAFARAHYRCPITYAITTARELQGYLGTRAATLSTRRARLTLRRHHPGLGADRVLLTHQSCGLVLLFLGLLAAAILAPQTSWYTLLVGCNLFYASTLIVKLLFFAKDVHAAREQNKAEQNLALEAAALDAARLPIYSILVPMVGESSEVMARLIASLGALDYPKEKLDVKLILEADDTACLTALKALHPPAYMEIIAVPPSTPRTKPKACNVAMQRLRGEYTVIYDAEDAPAPDQLKRALVMFARGAENLACVQARLNYYNRNENTLTKMFALEYSALFRLLLPALERLGLPIPLGGTSNHLKTTALIAAGGWDAFNVTEDADLGIRLAYLGYTTRTLPSLTLEESPITLRAWMKQRTRWIKGYIQTWLVYTRDTSLLKTRLGFAGYYGFQFFIGAPALTFLLAPLFWVAFILSLTGAFGNSLPLWLQLTCAFSFVGGVLSHWLFARTVVALEGWTSMGRAFALYPFYWLLHSVAAARALWQLITAPHYWEKTVHGVSASFTAEGLHPAAVFTSDTLFGPLAGTLVKRAPHREPPA